MVMFSQNDKTRIGEAIGAATARTAAEIALVVAPASDIYQGYAQLYGFALASAIGLALWAAHMPVDFPAMLCLQLAAMAAASGVPWLRQLCIALVPRRIRHARAAHRAYEEYIRLAERLPPGVPFALLYISLAERYVHVLGSHDVRHAINAHGWKPVIAALTGAVRSHGLCAACVQAIGQAGDVLAAHFPATGQAHRLADAVIELP
jgi:putative membrane protein